MLAFGSLASFNFVDFVFVGFDLGSCSAFSRVQTLRTLRRGGRNRSQIAFGSLGRRVIFTSPLLLLVGRGGRGTQSTRSSLVSGGSRGGGATAGGEG